MKILITGAGGFLGACASYYLERQGHQVVCGVRNAGRQWRLEEIASQKIEIDVSDAKSVERAVSTSSPDAIANFAAYGAYPGRETDEAMMRAANVDGVANIVEAAKRHGVGKFVHIGTSSEYGMKDRPISENDAPAPDTEYGKTKLEGAKIALDAAHACGAVVLRPFSPYGYWEDRNRLLPTLVAAALAGRPAHLSSPHPKRDFIFVDCLNDAIVRALSTEGISGEAFNIGGGWQLSVGEMAEVVNSVVGTGVPPIYGKVENPRQEPQMWQADISKAKRMLGWEPAFGHQEGVRRMAEWMARHAAHYAGSQ